MYIMEKLGFNKPSLPLNLTSKFNQIKLEWIYTVLIVQLNQLYKLFYDNKQKIVK